MSEDLFGDRPISHPKDDAFGLSSFADALATSVLKMRPKNGLVISVEGPWGAGKSSALALAVRTVKIRVLNSLGERGDELERLSESQLNARWEKRRKVRKTHIVHFNPWNFSGQENLVRAFFIELAAQIDAEPDGKLTKAANNIAGYLPSVLSGAAIAGMLSTGHLPGATLAAGAGRAAGEAAERALRSDRSLEVARKNLVGALRKSDQRIIVIIDDLDRLTPSEMRSVLSLVKSLGDLPNTIYLLSFDENVVRSALEESAEKIDPAFIEKIVQVSLKLPPPWRDELRQLFFIRLESIIGEVMPADEDRWRRMLTSVIDPYLQTPRDVTRLANTVQVIWPNVAGDVDLIDILALTTLQLFEPNVYSLIQENIEVITHANYRYENDDAFADRMDPRLATKPELAKRAMALLFPRLAKLWNKLPSDSSLPIMQREQRRICTKKYHRNYFVFGRDARMLSRAEVEGIILSKVPSDALAATLKRLEDTPPGKHPSRVANFLNQISETLYAKPLLTPALLQAILDHSDDLIRREDEVWEFYVTHNYERLCTVIRQGVKRLDEARRAEALNILVNNQAGLLIRADTVEDDARSHGLFGGQLRHESERLFAADRIEAAALAIRDQVAAACRDGSVWQTPMPMRLIWAWLRMSDKGQLSDWFKDVLDDDDLAVRLADELPGRSYQSGGGHGTRVVWTFDRVSFRQLFDTEELFARLEAIASKNSKAASALARLQAAEAANKG